MKPEKLFSQTINGGVNDYLIEVKKGVGDQKYLSITRVGEPSRETVMVLHDRVPEFLDAIIHAAGAIYHDVRVRSDYQMKVDQTRAEYANAYLPWKPEDDQLLIEKHQEGCTIDELSDLLKRQPGAIRSRLEKITPQ